MRARLSQFALILLWSHHCCFGIEAGEVVVSVAFQAAVSILSRVDIVGQRSQGGLFGDSLETLCGQQNTRPDYKADWRL